MLPAEVAAFGLTTARKLSDVATDNDNEDGFDIPLWVILVTIVLVLTLFFCGCTCFVIRCFAPENTQGPAWEINSYGKRWVKGHAPGNGKDPVAHELGPKTYPGAIPVHTPDNDTYDPNNPQAHMRPAYYEEPNNPQFREDRQEVLDKLNGLHVARNGGRLVKNAQEPRQTAV